VIGITIVIIVFASVAGGRKPTSTRATADLTAVTTQTRTSPAAVNPSERAWYQALAGARDGMLRSVAAVRRYLAAQDGVGLRPACAILGAAATAARSHPPAPTSEEDALFSRGAEDYAGAAAWCSRLFDGTRMQVPTLQSNILSSLSQGDGQWGELARRLGEQASPMARAPGPVAATPVPGTAGAAAVPMATVPVTTFPVTKAP
jgi:hypothetical protein